MHRKVSEFKSSDILVLWPCMNSAKSKEKNLFILIFVDTIQQFQLITMINDVCFMQKSMI